MASQDISIPASGFSVAAVQQGAVAGMRAVFRMAALATAMAAASVPSLSTAAFGGATITVNSLADPSVARICTLHDAITAANTRTATNGCIAGRGNDTIRFRVRGTILLASTLPEVTGSLLIKGPASPGITISGGGRVQVMQVASGASLNLTNLTIADGLGQSGDGAGGIINQGTLTITDSTFSGSSGGRLETGSGAGAIANRATLTVINGTFSDNNSGVFGIVGGILNQDTLTVINSTFSGNRTGDNNAGDGGIFSLGTLTVTNSTFADNVGDGHGAIYNGGAATITNSTFSNNSAGVDGGDGAGGFSNGIRFFSSTARANITNSTFSGNRGLIGAGALLNGMGSTLTVTNSTFSGNPISNYGVASLNGTILAGGCSVLFGEIPITDLGYNISQDDSCGLSATGSHNSTDPKLDPAGLRNNRGLTETIALLLGSPAVDAIPLASCTDQAGNPLAADQRGFPRPDAGEAICDIGAFEFQDIDFAGQPGAANCRRLSVSALNHQYGNINAAASALGFPFVRALRAAIRAFCGG